MNAFTKFTFKNGATMRNRFALAPMTTYSGNDDLTLSDEEEIYYNSRSKEIGMVITAACAVSKQAQAFHNQISIMDETYIPSMKRLANAIKKEGALAVLQLHHGGRMNAPGLFENQDIVSASSIKANRPNAVLPRALDTREVYEVIDDFVHATKLAILAGFDGIEIHGANTYLLQQFFSPHSNQRTDEFGGSLEKRLTFPLLLTKKVLALRDKMKKDFIIGYRFSPEELEEPGITLNDTFVLVDHLAALNLDYLHVSLGRYNQTSIRDKSDTKPIAIQLLDVINNRVPLIGVGGFDSLEKINKGLELGYSLIGLGMITISDKDAVLKLKQKTKLSKIISKESLLPTPLYNRLKAWTSIEQSGYQIK